jgi:hypothetical protein
VTTVETYLISRPLVPTAAACAPMSAVPSVAAPRVTPVAVRAQLPREHQVQAPAQPAADLLPTTGSNGTIGFRGGMGAWTGKKRTTTHVRGIPPRGKPA